MMTTVAFENIGNEIFDLLMTVVVNFMQASEASQKIPQQLVQSVSLEMILNNMKTMKTSEVDRQVLFLQLLIELLKDCRDWRWH